MAPWFLMSWGKVKYLVAGIVSCDDCCTHSLLCKVPYKPRIMVVTRSIKPETFQCMGQPLFGEVSELSVFILGDKHCMGIAFSSSGYSVWLCFSFFRPEAVVERSVGEFLPRDVSCRPAEVDWCIYGALTLGKAQCGGRVGSRGDLGSCP